jgi:hypothetical protein
LKKIIEKIALFGYFISVLFKHVKINKTAEKLGYYKSIDDIPIYNWDKIEQGYFEYLYIDKIGTIPEYFMNVIGDMFFSLEKVNMKMIEKKHRRAYLKNLHASTGRPDFLVDYKLLDAEIKKEESKEVQRTTLNEKINFVETAFNSIGSIDPKIMSAGRFYSLLDLALKKVEKDGVNR